MKFSNFLQYLTERHKLSLRNIRTGKEIWHIFSSRLNLILSLATLVIVLFVLILTMVAYTSILDFIPGYPGNKSRKLIIENIARLDSLESQVREWELYNRNLTLILEGKTIATAKPDSGAVPIKGHIVPRSYSDSILRNQIETDSNYMFLQQMRHRAEVTFEMVAPTRGAITKTFNPKADMFGVEITPQPNQVVMAVLDGTVIDNSWGTHSGNIIMVQHAGNMVSIYKKVARSLCKTGQRVKSGEAIAMTATITDGKTPSFVFELWNSGNAVDPENYITF